MTAEIDIKCYTMWTCRISKFALYIYIYGICSEMSVLVDNVMVYGRD